MDAFSLPCPVCSPTPTLARIRRAELRSWFPDQRLESLVELRMSQIYSCAACIDQHRSQAADLGESTLRLDDVADWRQSGAFDEREKAAFAWAEAVTLLAQNAIPDAVYDGLATYFTPEEIGQLRVIADRLRYPEPETDE